MRETVKRSSGWLDTIADLREQITDDPNLNGDFHAVAYSILILATTVERQNILLQEMLNDNRRIRRHKR